MKSMPILRLLKLILIHLRSIFEDFDANLFTDFEGYWGQPLADIWGHEVEADFQTVEVNVEGVEVDLEVMDAAT